MRGGERDFHYGIRANNLINLLSIFILFSSHLLYPLKKTFKPTLPCCLEMAPPEASPSSQNNSNPTSSPFHLALMVSNIRTFIPITLGGVW